MTPAELSTFLLSKGFDEDVVQDVIVVALTQPSPRYPKAWACTVARHLLWKRNLRPILEPLKLLVIESVWESPKALDLTIARQELEQVMSGKRKVLRKRGGQRLGGRKEWLKDYRALQSEQAK